MFEINKIYNENCLDTMSKMSDNFIDLTVTSPPYDNIRNYKGYSFDFENIAKELFRVTKLGGAIAWIVADSTKNGNESGTSFKQALYFKEVGFNLYDTMIYNKLTGGLPHKNTYTNSFEYMFILTKGKLKTFNPIKDRPNKNVGQKINRKRKIRETNGELTSRNVNYTIEEFGFRYNVWNYLTGNHGNDKIAFEHPAVFPEKLANDHILSWSNEGDLIYDPFSGSGTTAKMAIVNKRNYVGSEMSKDYCDLIERRLQIYK